MNIRVLSAADVKLALPMAAAVEGMKTAFRQLSAGAAAVPLRSRVDVPNVNGVSLFMPAHVPDETGGSAGTLAVKVVSVFGDNPKRGRPIIYGVVMVLDAATGQPLALMEGGSLTAIRTGAGSGAATDLLARPDARVAAIFGSGAQARTQLEAVCTVRSIEQVWVYSPTPGHADAFATDVGGQGRVPSDVLVANSPRQAVQAADIICAATTSSVPVFDGQDLKPGAHINGVGSFTPEMQEVDVATVRRSLVVVDAREAALAEAGDLIHPINSGDIGEDHIHAELGEIVAGTKPGRTSDDQITYFKSCGVAVQDAVAAGIALAEAERLGLGTTVTL
ncbi:MAG: ornithine cyclodeaminase family protein [Anaerolineales bacterium]